MKPETEIVKETSWSRIREQNSVYKEFLEIVGNGKPTGSVKGDNCSFRHDVNRRGKTTQSNTSPKCDLLNVDHQMLDNWVVCFKSWRRRSLVSGRAQTCGSQSSVWNSQRLLRVTLKFEIKILRSDIFAHLNLSSVEAGQKCGKKLKEHQRAAFFSLSENRCLLASTLKPEEREFVFDSGASMHMISKKDLSEAEMDILTKSCSPTIVITANGEVQTHEEAIVYVKELEKFFTMKVLDKTPAVLSLGKLCDENGNSYPWINVQKPHLIKNGIRIQIFTENFVPIVVPGLSSSSSASSSTLRTLMKHVSYSSSSSPSSPTIGEIQDRTREDATNRDISPVAVSNLVDDRSGKPDEVQANKNPKPNEKETTIERSNPLYSEIPEWVKIQGKFGGYEIPLQGGSHASSSHEVFFNADYKETWGFGSTQCLYSFLYRPKLRDL